MKTLFEPRRRRRAGDAKWIILPAALIFLLFCGSSSRALERLEPPEGCYFGFTIGADDTIPKLNARLGFKPAVYVRFFRFSMVQRHPEAVRAFLSQVAAARGIAMVTLEPMDGLGVVTEGACREVAALCAEAENKNIPGIMIRFGHEMNGNWYPWGQMPTAYQATFRLLAQTVRSRTSRTAMLWAPNYGVGYPFGQARPAVDSADFAALDTDDDGRITDRDDPYEPYYPGDDVVDWVGLTLYHWGLQFPWRENEMPAGNNLAGSLAGTYQGSIPNFYQRYCEDPARNKPFAIAETAAFYNTEMDGPPEMAIKQAWWRQVFNTAMQFPKIKCINWFEEHKPESVAQDDWIDWRVTADAAMREAFVSELFAAGNGYFLASGDVLTANISVEGNQVVIRWRSNVGSRYQLFSTADFRQWISASAPIQGTGGELREAVEIGVLPGCSAFRVQVLTP